MKCIQLLNLILEASRGLIWIQAFSWQVKRSKAEKDEHEKNALSSNRGERFVYRFLPKTE